MAKGMPEGVRVTIGWVLGVGIIALIALILVILFGNLQGNVGFGQDSTAFTNETIVFTDTVGTQPATAQNRVNPSLSGVVVTNATGGETVPTTNYTTSGSYVISVGAGSPYNGTNVNVSGTVTYDSRGKIDSDNIIFNYTDSATNVSAQFPTLGVIIGVALLLVILVGVLIYMVKKLSSATSMGSGNSRFKGSDASYA